MLRRPEFAKRNEEKKGDQGGESKSNDWIHEIKVMRGCLDNNRVKACSIFRVSDKVRRAKEDAYLNMHHEIQHPYTPNLVSIGPFHKGTSQHLMEETKWRYMNFILKRGETKNKGANTILDIFCNQMRGMDTVIRASYGGSNVELKPEELARIMLLDGCFILELLLRLYDCVTGDAPFTADEKDKDFVDPILGDTKNKYENNKILPVLSDLSLVENQIPFIVLKNLYDQLSRGNPRPRYPFPKIGVLVKSLFDFDLKSISSGVFHFLHFMHLSSISTNNNNTESDYEKKSQNARQELKRCATQLQACGIEIQKNPDTADKTGSKTSGVASALSKYVDKLDLKIELNERGQLKIPALHINEGTEVKWSNLIVWEQSGIGMGYKFSSYAMFLKGLICSLQDLQLLKANNVIIVDDPGAMKDKDLMALFGSITSGVEQMDCRYSELCERLNSMTVDRATKHRKMSWHYCGRVLAWVRHECKIWIKILKQQYFPHPWAFLGLVAATVLLVLTVMQTYYAARGS